METSCDPYKKRGGFYIPSHSIPPMSSCICYCSLREIDYSYGHQTWSSNKCFGTVLTLHTTGLIWLGGATALVTIGSMGISRELYPSRLLSGWMTLLPRAYPAQKLLPGSCPTCFHCVLVMLLPMLCQPRVLSVQVTLLSRAYLAEDSATRDLSVQET